jgi:hypothetical protein
VERRQLARGRAALRRGAFGVAAAAALTLASCGGSSASFAERADRICLTRERATAALQAPRSPAQAFAVFLHQQRLVEAEADALAALDPPGGEDRILAALAAHVRKELAAADRLRTASLSGDTEMAQGAYAQGRKAARQAHADARRLGLEICGRA